MTASVRNSYERWLRRDRSKPNASTRLFCFPYAGVGASVYRGWQRAISADIDVIPIQLPGREDRFSEVHIRSVDQLLDELGEAIVLCADRPFFFFGHSLGALIAFELARYLKKWKLPEPFHLIASGSPAPHLRARHDPIYQLEDWAFLERIRSYDGTPPAILSDPDLLKLFVPILRSDFAMAETYKYRNETLLDCNLTALGGDNDPHVALDEILAWRLRTTAVFAWRQFPGNHFYMHEQQHAIFDVIAEIARASNVRGEVD